MIKRILAHIIANGVALYLTAELLSTDFAVTGGFQGYLIAAVLFGILNGIVKPVLKILSLPFVFLTAGLFIIVINVFLVWFAAYALEVLDFENTRILIEGGVTTYIYAGLLISIVNGLIHWLLKK